MTVSTKTLTILNTSQKIKCSADQTLLDALNSSKVKINHECGGHGICTTCLVITHSDASCFNERKDLELERAEERGFQINERLACQTTLLNSAVIEIPEYEE